jgi:aryl-phospho-beta-D-glucosidase BglC (GH1 family)
MIAFLALHSWSAGDWYTTKGHDIVNSQGKVVRLSGLNWFGFDTSNEVFHGLWSVNMHNIVKQVYERGFNCFRVPISAKVLQDWKNGRTKKDWPNNQEANKDLVGLTNLQVFDLFITDLKKYKLKMFIDIHGIKDDIYQDGLWFDKDHPVSYIEGALEWFATHYRDEDTVIGIDLFNEPAGHCQAQSGAARWDNSTSPENWKRWIETIIPKLLTINPNLLMLVEGIECWEGSWGWRGGNLVAYSYFPFNLGKYAKQLVFAPHEYGPAVYKDQWWFKKGFNYQTLYDDHWYGMWMYLWERKNGPILIGEWGGHTTGDDLTWMKALVQLITKYQLSQTFWCLNPNSGDTGGLLLNDWKTWDEVKYNIIKPVLVNQSFTK